MRIHNPEDGAHKLDQTLYIFDTLLVSLHLKGLNFIFFWGGGEEGWNNRTIFKDINSRFENLIIHLHTTFCQDIKLSFLPVYFKPIFLFVFLSRFCHFFFL